MKLNILFAITFLMAGAVVAGCGLQSPACNYDDPSRNYVKQDPNCVINFLCESGTAGFSDACGCGCESTGAENLEDLPSYRAAESLALRSVKDTSQYKLYNPAEITLSKVESNVECDDCWTFTYTFNVTKTSGATGIVDVTVTVEHSAVRNTTVTEEGLEEHTCTEEQKAAEVCFEIYMPVCGWFNQSIQCIRYPCAGTYTNSCFACMDPKVDRWTEGQCPG